MPDLPKQIGPVRIHYNHDDAGNFFATFVHTDKRWMRIPIVEEDGMEVEITEIAEHFDEKYRSHVEQYLED
jgi:hypothetical protein